MIVSRETEDRLVRYQTLLTKWNSAINLVAPATLADARIRHIEDSAQLWTLCSPRSGHWVDLGSGGGLPGIVVSIMAQGTDVRVTLVESDQRKATFLRTVIRELQLTQVSVLSQRIEELAPLLADFLSARALAPMIDLLPMIQRHLAPDGQAWLLKGARWRDECDAAQSEWQFNLRHFPSMTNPDAAILTISGVSHA